MEKLITLKSILRAGIEVYNPNNKPTRLKPKQGRPYKTISKSADIRHLQQIQQDTNFGALV